MNTLSSEVQKSVLLRDQLLQSFQDIDDETLADTLEGLTSAKELIAEILRSSLADDVLAKALKARLDEMRERLSRIEATRERKREMACRAMVQLEMPKLLEPDFTVSLRAGGQSVEVTEPSGVPAEYWVAQEPKLDKVKLQRALKDGLAVPGAVLVEGAPTISLRRS